MEFEPHLTDEISRIRLSNFFFYRNKIKKNNQISTRNLNNLSRATRYLDLIFLSRLKCAQSEILGEAGDNSVENLFLKQNMNFTLSFNHRFPLLVESLNFLTSSKDEMLFLGFFFLNYLKKKKLSEFYLFYMKNFFENKKTNKKITSIQPIYQFDLFFQQESFAAAKNCLSHLIKISEKENLNRFVSGEIAFRAGKMAFIEKKVISAFPNFLEAFEKIGKKKRLKIEQIIEWILFCSNLMQKPPFLPFKKGESLLSNKKNYIVAKFLGNSLNRKDLTSLQIGISGKWRIGNFPIRKILTAIHFNFLKKSLGRILRSCIRISFDQLALMIGTSKKTLEFLVSTLVIRKNFQGVFDYKTKSLNYFGKTKNRLFFKNFLKISVHLNTILTMRIKRHL